MRTENLAKDACACLSLAYKYVNLIDCVTDQRPQLLTDPMLATVKAQREALDQMFEARVREIAAGA